MSEGMPEAQRKAPSREAMLAVHQFPGEYVIKAFGPGHPDFHTAVVAAAHAEVEPARASHSPSRPNASRRSRQSTSASTSWRTCS